MSSSPSSSILSSGRPNAFGAVGDSRSGSPMAFDSHEPVTHRSISELMKGSEEIAAERRPVLSKEHSLQSMWDARFESDYDAVMEMKRRIEAGEDPFAPIDPNLPRTPLPRPEMLVLAAQFRSTMAATSPRIWEPFGRKN